jgi:hypothetical protein
VPSNSQGEIAVGNGRRGHSGLVQPGHVMPMPGEAIAPQLFLQAEDVDGGRLLPERALRGLRSVDE